MTNRRVLLIDDMPAIHEDFRKILLPSAIERAELGAVEAALFGDESKAAVAAFELDSAHQGQEGLALLQASLDAGRPYAMAFVDMRMPPGWDGVETIERLWQADARLQCSWRGTQRDRAVARPRVDRSRQHRSISMRISTSSRPLSTRSNRARVELLGSGPTIN